MPRVNLGAFHAPHHPIEVHPMPQFPRDLDLAEHLDTLELVVNNRPAPR